MEQELIPLSNHLSAPSVFSGVRFYSIFSLVSFDMYVLLIVSFHFVLFILAIVLSVLLRFTSSDYHFGIYMFVVVRTGCQLAESIHVC